MLRLTVTTLLAHRFRLLLSAVAIATAAAFVAGTFILTDSVQAALDSSAAPSATSAVVVQPSDMAGGKGAAPGTSLPAVLVTRISTVRGVADAEGLVSALKVTLIGPSGRPITHRRALNELLSYPAAAAFARQYTIESGHAPTQPGQALIDAATAHALGYRAGDQIGVVTADGLRHVAITGITGFAGASSPAALQIASFDTPTVLVVPTVTAQRLTGLTGRFTEIDVLAARGVSGAALRRRITAVLPPGTVALTSEQAAAQNVASAAGYLGNLRGYLLAFAVASILVAAFVIASTFTILSGQRTREYALLRVIGAARRQVLRSCLFEALLLGLVASAAGAVLGAAAAAGLRGVIALLGGTLPAASLVFEPRTAALTLATGTAATVAAALVPARRAARTPPMAALRAAEAVRPGRARSGLIMAVAGFASRWVGRRASMTMSLARDNATRDPRRTAALAGILTIGLAAAIAVDIIAASAQAAARDAVSAASRADFYLTGQIGPGLARAVISQPGVQTTMRVDDPMVQVAGTQARIDGIDPASASAIVTFGVASGSLSVLRGNALFVSAAQASNHGWHVGSAVTVSFGQGPPRTLHVVGTFADKRFLGDDYLMPIATLLRDMPDQDGQAGLLLVRAAPGVNLSRIRHAIAALLPRYPGVSMLTSAGYRAARAADLGDVSHVLGLFTALVVLTDIIATLGIANALTLSISQRRRELAVLRALGLSRPQLATMIRAESMITCLVGMLPGIVTGAVTGAVIAANLTRSQTGAVTISASPAQMAAAVILTCLAAMLAGALPARRAARVEPARAMVE